MKSMVPEDNRTKAFALLWIAESTALLDACLRLITRPTLRPNGTPVGLNLNRSTKIESRWDFE